MTLTPSLNIFFTKYQERENLGISGITFENCLLFLKKPKNVMRIWNLRGAYFSIIPYVKVPTM